MESFACSFRIKASRSMPEIHGYKPVGQRSFREWRREGRSRSPGQAGGQGIPRRDSPATGGGEAKGRVLPGRPGPAPQALLSSTLTARGLIAPVRFSGEAAEGGSCSFTAPKPGFSSTRCFACRSAVTARSLLQEHSVYCRQSGSPSSPSERTLCWC